MPYRDMPKRDMGARITEKEGLEEISGGKGLEVLETEMKEQLFDFNSKFYPIIS